MKSLLEYVRQGQAKKVAIGHFNISNLEMLHGIFNAARLLGETPGAKDIWPDESGTAGSAGTGAKVPVIIGVSEGERDFIGLKQAVALIHSLREEYDYPIFLNADHSYSLDRVKEAVDAGFDSAIIDGAKLGFDDNVVMTKQCVDYARTAEQKTGRKTLIEAELGYIGQSSKVLDAIPEGVKLDEANLTSPEQAQKFVAATGVDMFAPAVGNIHGMLRVGHDPRLDIKLVGEIAKTLTSPTGEIVPLVLHGGSGTVDEDFTAAIKAGIAIVHISTELRVAYQKAIKLSLQQNPEEVAPYKYMKPSVQAVQEVAFARLKLFTGLN